jgi:hypothetical protein
MVVDQAIATSKFLPTVAELKRLRTDLGLDMTAEERKRAYLPDSLRGIAVGSAHVYAERDQRQLTAAPQPAPRNSDPLAITQSIRTREP